MFSVCQFWTYFPLSEIPHMAPVSRWLGRRMGFALSLRDGRSNSDPQGPVEHTLLPAEDTGQYALGCTRLN